MQFFGVRHSIKNSRVIQSLTVRQIVGSESETRSWSLFTTFHLRYAEGLTQFRRTTIGQFTRESRIGVER